MKKLFLFCFTACLCVAASAQKVYFLYLQTDDQAPFYVRMSDKIYSSSTSGYIILPNLVDSTYTLNVGYAKSTRPELKFAVTINQNDKGYLIKNFSDGPALFDLQDLSIVKAVSSNRDNTVYETKTDKFSSMLSKAADDPGLLKVPVVVKEEPKAKLEEKEVVTAKVEETKAVDIKPTDTVVSRPSEDVVVNAEQKKDTTETEVVSVPETTVQLQEDKQPVSNVQETVATTDVAEFKRSVIVRRSESSTTEGFGVVYLDKYENVVDTIRILIPPSKYRIDQDAQTSSLSEIEKRNSIDPVSDPSKTEVKVGELMSEANEKKEEKEAESSVALNGHQSACKEIASEKDFLKLRKNMASETNDEEMIGEAKKVFKNKCFTTEQLRYLSTLFLTSAAKYQFFDAAYNYVSDKKNFASLQNEIKDEYYLKRFKALVGE